MDITKDPFELVIERANEPFEELTRKSMTLASPSPVAVPGAVIARLHGFSVDDEPLLSGLDVLPGEIVPARTTVRLLRSQIGSRVVLLFAEGDVRQPIIVGIIEQQGAVGADADAVPPLVSLHADDDRLVVSAEREIVLQCGEASITLTRAGKVIIKGAYIVSRSSGYVKIKGAAVDIN